MKALKTVNRGLIVSLAVLIAVVVYVKGVSMKADAMEALSDSFIADFLIKDSEWKTIPAEYRNDEQSYIAKIEPDVRAYFDSDSSYNYYIDNNISHQYRTGSFCEHYSASVSKKYDNVYNKGVLESTYQLYISYKTDGNTSSEWDYSYTTFSFVQINGEIKIHYIDFGLNGSGNGEYFYYDDYGYRYGY